MEEQLVTFETAKLAKEKGFKEKTKFSYSTLTKTYNISYDEFSAPTQSLLQKWLREKHNIFLTIHCNSRNKYTYQGYDVDITKSKYKTDEYPGMEFGSNVCIFDTYEEALERGLIEALELI